MLIYSIRKQINKTLGRSKRQPIYLEVAKFDEKEITLEEAKSITQYYANKNNDCYKLYVIEQANPKATQSLQKTFKYNYR